MAILETRARGEVPAVVERRLRTAGPGHRSERKRSSRWPGPAACTLEERRPRHSSAPVGEWTAPPLPKRKGARRNRRALCASAGGKHGGDGRLRPESTSFLPVVGDHQIADVSAANPRYDLSVSARSFLRICVICVICGQIAMALCALCVSVPLWFSPGRLAAFRISNYCRLRCAIMEA